MSNQVLSILSHHCENSVSINFELIPSHRSKFNMNSKKCNDLSFSTAAFLLKYAGYWFHASRVEKWFRNFALVYSMCAVSFCAIIEARAVYYLWGDYDLATKHVFNGLIDFIDLFKLATMFVHKELFLNLIAYMKENFWHSNYDQHENLFIANAKQMSIYFVCIFTFCTETTIFSYIIRAIVSNIGRNESDRELILEMFLGPTSSLTPYFEIIFVTQIVTLLPVGTCYLCFDNMFFIMCLHVSSLFRILRYRIAKMPRLLNEKKDPSTIPSDEVYAAFRDCIEQHKSLIEFCNSLEETFRVIILGQMVMFSALISFAGYQVVVVDLTPSWRISLLFCLLTNVSQLWMFTYSCDCIMRESLKVSSAVYDGPWIHLPNDIFGKMIRKDLQMVVMRARQPCCLTACGFFPISLETFTKIMSTAVSYFTILNQSSEDSVDT